MSPSDPNTTPLEIFDQALIARRIDKQTRQEPDFITQLVCDDLAARLAPVSRPFSKAIIMAPQTLGLPKRGQSAGETFAFAHHQTLSPQTKQSTSKFLPETDYDLIISLLDLQIVNDVPGYLARLRAHLAPDGLMLAAALGGNSLNELRRAWLFADEAYSGGAYTRVAPFIDVRDAGALLQRAGFALPVADVETHLVRYKSPLALMQELKALAASNPLTDRPKTFAVKQLLADACKHYEAIASDEDGRIRATLEIVWMSGWAPHESQQKPLAPGSADVSLTKILSNRPKK